MTKTFVKGFVVLFVVTYLCEHFVGVVTEVTAEGTLIGRVQILLHEAGSVDLIIRWLVQYFDGLSAVLFD